MQLSNSQRVLKVFSVLGIIVGALDFVGAALLQAVGNFFEGASAETLAEVGLDLQTLPDIETGMILLAILMTASGVVHIVCGLFGQRTANEESNGTLCLVLCGISVILELIAYMAGVTPTSFALFAIALSIVTAVSCWQVRGGQAARQVSEEEA